MKLETTMTHLKAMMEINGFSQLTDIQTAVIPLINKSKDVIATSKTGTGKTHAYLFPIFERLNPEYQHVQAVITAPTRELATQIFNFAQKISVLFPEIRVELFTGGVDRARVVAKLHTQPHLVIGTPGRLKDLFLDQSALRLDTSGIFVVDEADMTLEYGFLDDIDMIVTRMGKKVQMLVFSATIPQALRPFLRKYLVRPQTVTVESDEIFKPRVNHILVPAKHLEYPQMLLKIMPSFQPYICLIFANTRVEAAQTAQLLRDEGISIIELHGDLTPRQRRQAMTQLENKEHSYIVATDIASRGLDISEVTHVVSLGFPRELEFFIHRSGRTGRAGKEGTCFTIYKDSDDAAIRHFQKQGIAFKHMTISAAKWRELKPYGYKHSFKRSETEIAIAKIVKRKDVKVKPGYKKKMSAEIELLKRKKRREFIQGEIKKQKKERAKAKSLAEKETT